MDKFMEQFKAPSQYTPEVYMRSFGVSYAEGHRMAETALKERVFVNGTYVVEVSPPHPTRLVGWPPMVHLSIMRVDKEPIVSWQDKQTIKNLFVGPEYEAMEIFPAESRLVDCANQYHVWAFIDRDFRIPMGWTERLVRTDPSTQKRVEEAIRSI